MKDTKTVLLDTDVYEALRTKAFNQKTSMHEVANDILRTVLGGTPKKVSKK